MTKKINLTFLIIILLYSLFCASQLGMTWDTTFHYDLGKERLDYLFSLGSNKVNEDTYIYSKLYPGVYSTISALIVQFFPRKYIVEIIYLTNLTFSALTILGISKISTELFNKQIGKITFIICFFNPIFFGHMAINSIDTIIAFSNIWFFYITLKYLKNQGNKEKTKNYIIFSSICLGLGMGVRLSFIATLIPIFLFIFIEIFCFKVFIKKNFSIKTFFQDTIKILIFSYLILILFWPHTHPNVLILPFKFAIEGLSFGWGVPLMLFNGETILTPEFPKSYILINLFYKMPEFIVIGFAIFGCLFYKIGTYFKKEIKNFYIKIFLIFSIIIFPNILLFFSPYSIYDGIRLFLYIIPFICIIPSILIFFIFKMIDKNFYKFIFYFLIILKIFFLFNFFSLTPYHYVYLNVFAGKYHENSKKFENDYWGASTKKLISSINKNDEIFKKDRVKIAVCGLPEDAQKHYLSKLKNLNFKIVNKSEYYDYIIMNNRTVWDIYSDFTTVKNPQTCFEKFSGEDIAKIQRRGLVLSKFTKNSHN